MKDNGSSPKFIRKLSLCKPDHRHRHLGNYRNIFGFDERSTQMPPQFVCPGAQLTGEAAVAAVGAATNEITGKAINEAYPTFVITSRLDDRQTVAYNFRAMRSSLLNDRA